ncbi:MAG: hypothetical protein Q4B65_01860, partial [Candidatus Saccharibacteria bacterium]|nr:hypothetical protein [Candidatus Saccharibacteria bacterium]
QAIIKKQHAWSNKNFYYTKNGRKEFMSLINKYLSDDIDNRWTTFHKEFFKNYKGLLDANYNQGAQLTQLSQENASLLEEVSKYRNGKLYRFSKKIYKALGKE